MAEPQIKQRAEQPYAGIRETVTMETLPSAVDRGFPALFGWLAERGAQPAGPPFIRYLKVDMERELVIDLGVPVSDAVAPDERVRAEVLPAGRWIVTLHVGHFDGLRDAHGALQEWARGQGLEWRESVEWYVTDPREEPDSSRWETELAYLTA
jgi:RNA polymerase sigma-70 factor, ECF subfamily